MPKLKKFDSGKRKTVLEGNDATPRIKRPRSDPSVDEKAPASSSSSSSSSSVGATVVPDTAAAASWPSASSSSSSSSSSSATVAAVVPLFQPFDIPQKLQECKQRIGALPFRLADIQNQDTDFAAAFKMLLYHVLGTYVGTGFSTDLVNIVCVYTSVFPAMLLEAFQRDRIVYRPIRALWFATRTVMDRNAPVTLRMSTLREWVEDKFLINSEDGFITLTKNARSELGDIRANGMDRVDRPRASEINRVTMQNGPGNWTTFSTTADEYFQTRAVPTLDFSVSTGWVFESGASPSLVRYMEAIIGLNARPREYRLPLLRYITQTGISSTDPDDGFLLQQIFCQMMCMGDNQPFVWAMKNLSLYPSVIVRDWLKPRMQTRVISNDVSCKSKRHKLQRRLLRWFASYESVGGIHWASTLLQRHLLPAESKDRRIQHDVEDDDDDLYGCRISGWREPEDTAYAMTPETELISHYNFVLPSLNDQCRMCHEQTDESDFIIGLDGEKMRICIRCDHQ